MVAKPRMSRRRARQFETAERPNLSILPLPRFYQMIRLGSGAALT